jgi:hypothetical protein
MKHRGVIREIATPLSHLCTPIMPPHTILGTIDGKEGLTRCPLCVMPYCAAEFNKLCHSSKDENIHLFSISNYQEQNLLALEPVFPLNCGNAFCAF